MECFWEMAESCDWGATQKTDQRRYGLLRARRERPRRRAAEQRDEGASPHSITSSAKM
jgi:hypothetical protein